MRLGTPDFRGDRLKAAREARGLSGAALAELTSVTRSSLSQYERGEQSPSPLVLGEIASALNLPPNHFCESITQISAPVFYRSFATAQKQSRVRAERKLQWISEIVDFLSGMVEFPEQKLPCIPKASDPLLLSLDEVEDIATETRRAWGLGDGPISNLVRLAENKGIITARQFLDSKKLDAFSYWPESKSNPLVVLSTDKDCAVRSRFDLAHEIAHLVLHRSIDARQLKNKDEFKLIEAQADRFAGAFLLPAKTFLRELLSLNLDAFLALKRRWKTSVALMVRRCCDLDAINDESSKRLWINIGRRGWRKREPLDDSLEIEQPQFIAKCFELLIDGKPTNRDHLLSQLSWTPTEIERLFGLAENSIDLADEETPHFSPRIIRFPSSE